MESDDKKESAHMAEEPLSDFVKRYEREQLQKEGINPEYLDAVDLDVAFTPVIAISGEQLSNAVNVTKLMGEGMYFVNHPLVSNPVHSDTLRVMRFRYLIRLKEQQARHLSAKFGGILPGI